MLTMQAIAYMVGKGKPLSSYGRQNILKKYPDLVLEVTSSLMEKVAGGSKRKRSDGDPEVKRPRLLPDDEDAESEHDN